MVGAIYDPSNFLELNPGDPNGVTIGGVVDNTPYLIGIEANSGIIVLVNTTTGKIVAEFGTLDVPQYPLGEAASYVILTGGALTVGLSDQPVSGNIGQDGSITGTVIFVSGADYASPLSDAAVADAAALYTVITALTPTVSFDAGAVVLDTVDVGNGAGIFTPGIYKGTAGATTSASSVVTLDGDGDYVFIFDGTIITGATTTFFLKNGAKASRIFWVTSGAVTTGATNIFKGTVLTPAAITTGAGNNVEGRLISTVDQAITTGSGATSTYYLPTA